MFLLAIFLEMITLEWFSNKWSLLLTVWFYPKCEYVLKSSIDLYENPSLLFLNQKSQEKSQLISMLSHQQPERNIRI